MAKLKLKPIHWVLIIVGVLLVAKGGFLGAYSECPIKHTKWLSGGPCQYIDCTGSTCTVDDSWCPGQEGQDINLGNCPVGGAIACDFNSDCTTNEYCGEIFPNVWACMVCDPQGYGDGICCNGETIISMDCQVCSDSDGNNQYNKGKVTAGYINSPTEYWDTCSGGILTEQICQDEQTKSEVYHQCSNYGNYECVDGRCQQTTPEPTCSDSDGGNEREVFGTVVFDGISYDDVCNGDILTEQICQDINTKSEVFHNCVNIGTNWVCSSGKCEEQITPTSCTDNLNCSTNEYCGELFPNVWACMVCDPQSYGDGICCNGETVVSLDCAGSCEGGMTAHGTCSTNKPKYCNNTQLIDKASICGCYAGYKVVGELCEKTQCNDGIDNDNNGCADLDDSGCVDSQDDDESGGTCPAKCSQYKEGTTCLSEGCIWKGKLSFSGECILCFEDGFQFEMDNPIYDNFYDNHLAWYPDKACCSGSYSVEEHTTESDVYVCEEEEDCDPDSFFVKIGKMLWKKGSCSDQQIAGIGIAVLFFVIAIGFVMPK